MCLDLIDNVGRIGVEGGLGCGSRVDWAGLQTGELAPSFLLFLAMTVVLFLAPFICSSSVLGLLFEDPTIFSLLHRKAVYFLLK